MTGAFPKGFKRLYVFIYDLDLIIPRLLQVPAFGRLDDPKGFYLRASL
jgi:hypothetical protein